VRGDDRNIDLRLLPSLRLRADRADDPPVELDVESGLIDERDDVARYDQSVRRMRPAHERLDTGELSRRYVYLRLVMNGKRAGLEGLLEITAAQTNHRHQPASMRLRCSRAEDRSRKRPDPSG